MIEIQGYRQRVERLIFSPDGNRIAFSGHRSGINLWNLDDQSVKQWTLGNSTGYAAIDLAFTQNSDWLVVATLVGVYSFKVPEWESLPLAIGFETQAALLRVERDEIIWRHQDALYCNALTGWQKQWSANLGFGIHGVHVVRRESNEIITSGLGGVLQFHNAETGEFTRRINTGVYPITRLRMTSDQRQCFLTLAEECVVLDGATFKPVQRLKTGTGRKFTDAAFHPSDRLLATTSNDQTVRIWDTTTWTEKTAFTWEIGTMRSVAFAPDGMRMAAGSGDGRVIVWDVDL